MFRRILVEEWQSTLTIISFSIFLSVFILTLIRTWRMPRERVQHLENLPLQDDAYHE